MTTAPVPIQRRQFFEGVIRFTDLVTYAVIAIGGIYAVTATPNTVVDQLRGAEWLVLVWSALLVVGGAVGFIGRLIRRWMIEVPATWLAGAGILIYFVVLGRYTFTSVTSGVATALVLAAFFGLIRRWAELQIFSSEPDNDFKSRVVQALRRRTKNFPDRSH